MPRGIYQHKPGQGFLNPTHTYTVRIGLKVYHRGKLKREADHAFIRAVRPCKGSPAPAAGQTVRLYRDGTELVWVQKCKP